MIVVRVPTASDDQFNQLLQQLQADHAAKAELSDRNEPIILTSAPAATVADLCTRLGIGLFSTAPVPTEI